MATGAVFKPVTPVPSTRAMSLIKALANRPTNSGLDAVAPWLIAAIATAALYFGKSILIPIILAGLVSFLLAPIASLFRRL